ncbi:MAG: DUF2460 domain-containing protein [Devosiaceae bacterium]|nr:DUF2460 domain-containing protein [Devosiaceae bacterium MH13]
MAGFKAFHDVNFPVPVARGSRVTARRQTEIVTLGSGHEERSTRWRHAKRTYDAGGGVRSVADLYAVMSFFEARLGQLHAFRFRDPLDHASGQPGAAPTATDQPLGTGDGVTTTFSLAKWYGATDRAIKLPVQGSVLVAIDGSPTTDFSLSSVGQVVFDNPPASGSALTVGYLFDVPARFDTDTLDVDLTAFTAGAIPAIPLIEVFLAEETANA